MVCVWGEEVPLYVPLCTPVSWLLLHPTLNKLMFCVSLCIVIQITDLMTEHPVHVCFCACVYIYSETSLIQNLCNPTFSLI